MTRGGTREPTTICRLSGYPGDGHRGSLLITVLDDLEQWLGDAHQGRARSPRVGRDHDRLPAQLDCRPIHVALALEAGGLDVVRWNSIPLFELRAEAALARRAPAAESTSA